MVRLGVATIALVSAVLMLPAHADEATSKDTTADHSKFKELKGPFSTGPEVTKACLTCHTEAAKQIQRTKHWTWDYVNPQTKQRLGKKNVLNNFCVSIAANQADCTACHAGYGWKDANYDFSVEQNVDCLICHDTTGSYRKYPGFAGHPLYEPTEYPPGSGKIAKPVDLAKVAQKVGKTSRDTCGACHFNGGGGDGTKHGDLDSSLAAPDKDLDVHMDATGLDFSCSTCHKGSGHDVAGSRYAPTAADTKGVMIRGKASDRSPTTCVACHGNAVHKEARLNEHSRTLACQTCHVPKIARGGIATKTSWDWSTAGKLKDGKRQLISDAKGHVTYDSRKGDFTYAENIPPEYVWFNGKVDYTLLGDKVSKGNEPVHVNRFEGSPTDGKSMIWPVKVFRGKQPYDPVNHTLVKPHTAGEDENAYWEHYDWKKAIAAGMADAKAPFSGQYDFIATDMSWPITHMVAPKNKALACVDCHVREGGRLATIAGVYMPGRDRWPLLDSIMQWLAALTLIGVLGHGAVRWWSSRRAVRA